MKALIQSIDRKVLVHDIFNDRFDVCISLLPPCLAGAAPVASGNPDGMVKAKDCPLLNISTRPAELPKELELVAGLQNAMVTAEMEFLSRSFKKLGIDLRVKYITDWAQLESYIQSDKVQLYRYAWSADVPILSLYHLRAERIYQPYVQGVVSKGLRRKRYLQLHCIWLSEKPL
jgi:hypothetical protein